MKNEFTISCADEAATDRLGRQLAAALEAGVVVALNGQLGAGKTRLVRAICDGLGIDVTQVNSPTFVLLQLYADGRIPVAHFDTYRLGEPEEFLAIGAEEYVNAPDWISLVEWADRVEHLLPLDRLTIAIVAESETSRILTLTSSGQRSDDVLRRLRQTMDFYTTHGRM